jgi:uncharacterized protein YneR
MGRLVLVRTITRSPTNPGFYRRSREVQMIEKAKDDCTTLIINKDRDYFNDDTVRITYTPTGFKVEVLIKDRWIAITKVIGK